MEKQQVTRKSVNVAGRTCLGVEKYPQSVAVSFALHLQNVLHLMFTYYYYSLVLLPSLHELFCD